MQAIWVAVQGSGLDLELPLQLCQPQVSSVKAWSLAAPCMSASLMPPWHQGACWHTPAPQPPRGLPCLTQQSLNTQSCSLACINHSDEEQGTGPEARYSKAYEAKVNPFAEFQRSEVEQRVRAS